MSFSLAAYLCGIGFGLAVALALRHPRVTRWLDVAEAWCFFRVLTAIAETVAEADRTRLAASPVAIRAPVLPPPPTERLAPAQAAVRYPVLEFERKNFNHYEQQLAQLDWVLGFWCGHSWPGGLRCDDRVKH